MDVTHQMEHILRSEKGNMTQNKQGNDLGIPFYGIEVKNLGQRLLLLFKILRLTILS